ncbi:MAG TPA: hypothetical protein DIU15_20965, partial [Deltaproteobacteria bacterium]|nr:hypothetical protein [Deltaproteobacteria bacterium]
TAEGTLARVDNGAQVELTAKMVSETRWVFIPSVPLEYSTLYTASVTWDDGQDSMEFTTSDVGSVPVEQNLVGRAYAWDVGSGALVMPAGAGAVLDKLNQTLLTGVVAQSDDFLGLLAARPVAGSDPPAQDLCTETADLTGPDPAGDDDDSAGDDDDSAGDDDDSAGSDAREAGGGWSDPYFSAGPADITVSIEVPIFGEIPLTFYEAEFSGTFVSSTPGGAADSIAGGAFKTFLDLRDTGIPCEQAAAFLAVSCEPCPNEAKSLECVNLWIVDLVADLVPDLSLVPRSSDAIDADPGCSG